jgi:prophage maintenance system killer protein
MITTEQARASHLLKQHHLFWEIDPSMIEKALIESDDGVIPRVFEYGNFQDIYDVIDLYGEEKVKHVLSTEKLKRTATVMAYLYLGVDRYNQYALPEHSIL